MPGTSVRKSDSVTKGGYLARWLRHFLRCQHLVRQCSWFTQLSANVHSGDMQVQVQVLGLSLQVQESWVSSGFLALAWSSTLNASGHEPDERCLCIFQIIKIGETTL